jgi:hypothetical protein
VATAKLCFYGQPTGSSARVIRRVKKLLGENWAAVVASAAEIDRRGALYSDELTALSNFWEGPEPEWLRIDWAR